MVIDGVPVAQELQEIIELAEEEEEGYEEEEEDDEDRFDEEIEFETDYKVTSTWDNHCNAEVTIKNINDEKVDNWEVAFTYTGEIENIWNGQIISHEDDEYIVKNAKWNQDIAPNESITFGFTAKYDIMPEEPTDFDIQKMEEDVVEDNYNLTYTQFTRWDNNVQGQVEITNTSDAYIEDWQLEFDTNMKMSQIWNAQVEEENENYLSAYEEVENEEDDVLVDYTYCLDNMGYNQNIAPGETVNFGFIAECVDDTEGVIVEPVLTQLTVAPEDEEEPDYDPDTDEEMEVVEGYEMDGDDYDRLEEDEEEEDDDDSVLKALSTSASQLTLTTSTTATNKCDSDALPYKVIGLPHNKQVQTWCLYNKSDYEKSILFVAQCDDGGDAIISLCKPAGDNMTYKYDSEIQIANAGHVQTLYCYAKKKKINESDSKKSYERYYIMLNAHGVKYKMKNANNEERNIVWSTRIARVAFNVMSEKVKDDKLIIGYEEGTTNGNCLKVVNSTSLKQLTGLAYSNKKATAFAGMTEKNKAELKRVEFAVSPRSSSTDKKYFAILKKSGNRTGKKAKMEYSLYNFDKIRSALEKADNTVSFKGKLKKKCLCSTKEKSASEIMEERTSIQGMAVDVKGNIYITSGDDKKHTDEHPWNIGIYKKTKTKKGYTKKIHFNALEADVTDDTWMRELIAEKIDVDERTLIIDHYKETIPELEIEGAQIFDGKIYYVVGAKKKTFKVINSEGKEEKRNLRSQAYVFSRKLTDLK